MKRPSLPYDLSCKILYECAQTCCVCKEPEEPVQIHHIDENPKNNVDENLAALCTSCHGKAHSKHKLAANLTKRRIISFKQKWIRHVASRSARAMVKKSKFNSSLWTYFHHARLPTILARAKVDHDPARLAELVRAGLVDEFGIPQPVEKPEVNKTLLTIYDLLPFPALTGLTFLDHR